MKSLLLVSALSLLPLTSMGADAPKAVNPATGAFAYAPNPASGAVAGATQKGSTASGSSQLKGAGFSSTAPGGAISGIVATPTPPPSGGTDSFTVTAPAPSGSYGGGIPSKK